MKSAIALALFMLASCGPQAPEPELETLARERLQQSLKDADSAKFRDLRKVGDDICGLVNAKNSYGAYAGYEPFWATDTGVFVEGADDTIPGLPARMCG